MRERSESPADRSGKHPNERIPIRLCPSRKEILKLEAERRSAPLAALINVGLEEIEPEGRPIPTPEVAHLLLDFSVRVRKIGRGRNERGLSRGVPEAKEKIDLIHDLVDTRITRSKALRTLAESEDQDEVIQARLTPKEARIVQEKADAKGVPVPSLLLTSMLKGIRKRSEKNKLERFLRRWKKKVKRLYDHSFGKGLFVESRDWEKVRLGLKKIGSEIDSVIAHSELQ